MAFQIDDIIIDRIQYGIAMTTDESALLYVLTQLQDATVNITASSKEARDKDDVLIKKFWNGKSGTFEATNALINLNILAASSGIDKVEATSANKITMPAIKKVKAGATGVTFDNVVDGTMNVYALGNNGAMGARFEKGTAASATEYAFAEGAFTPPTAEGVEQYIVYFSREVESGIAIYNQVDNYPSTVRLVRKVLAVDPCTVDTIRAGYLVLPSFQVSPEVSLGLTTDSTLSYSGVTNFCYIF